MMKLQKIKKLTARVPRVPTVRVLMTSVQRELCMLMVVFLVIAGIGAYYIEHTPNDHPGIIRLHVIANSDLPEDQAVKLAVRNAVLEGMEGQEEIEDARQYIDAHLTEIEERAETIIRQAGYDYSARAVRKVTFIPEKQYEDLVLPAGNYEALQITLGKGDGQNWWCVIFPQLCLIGEPEASADGGENTEEPGLTGTGGGDVAGQKIILKSKIKEMLKKQVQGQ